MLIEFNVQNFRSIKEEVTFSLVASADNSLDNNLIKTDLLRDNLLRSAVIYGANASGKSNVILAFNFLKIFVETAHTFQKGTKINYFPFKLDKKCLSKPSKFKVVFIKNNIKYVYGISHNSEKIIDEYLYYYPKDRRALIFERSDTNNYRFTIDRKEQKFISEKTLDNIPYLSNSTQLNYKKTSEAFDWFKDNLGIVGADHRRLIEYTIQKLNEDKKMKKFILNALIEADLGINDLSASIEVVPMDEIPIPIRERLKTMMPDIEGKLEKIDIKTIHKVLNEVGDENYVEFDFGEESEGTKKLFSLIGLWIDSLNNGRVLIVDELDTKLHHLLNVFLIKLFNDPTQNKNNAQLIFTTHNTNLLNLDLFRRDQIWFTEKNHSKGSTDLYSLIEFRPRKDKNIQKGYLAGRYGAIPFIGDDRIF
ncbi:MAG: AAA domain, putative AbiEii toxin, Type IV TA system [Candidatus Argoarchaeum ethanivorans]|uniref:AAA domain, putative AbiEii toxin, Type IV TA system n=1 Tax=Candidatus Argoarchaeum ethanivorans TaxID=2608793 RepID=A0A811T4R0_9EURY|nr:MAG: AAA domain, putative AbiEii toxin, Type IV TA system [Candidatus Argoarchaeum ethanivorans]